MTVSVEYAIHLECTFPLSRMHNFPLWLYNVVQSAGAARIFQGAEVQINVRHGKSPRFHERNTDMNTHARTRTRTQKSVNARTHESWIICWINYYVNGVHDVAHVISRYWPVFSMWRWGTATSYARLPTYRRFLFRSGF